MQARLHKQQQAIWVQDARERSDATLSWYYTLHAGCTLYKAISPRLGQDPGLTEKSSVSDVSGALYECILKFLA
mgnify:FL=1